MENMFKFYEVGGKVRDEILGLESKDVDYVAVPNDKLLQDFDTVESMFSMLEQYLKDEKFEIFLVTPDCFTIRAKFPKDHRYSGVADFVMARKEVGYIPGTRTPIVKPGTLYDDLERRDATLNALAKDEDGTIIDYFGGLEDLTNRVLRTPLEPIKTFDDDALRIIRFIRFSITKGFSIPNDITNVIRNYDYESKMGVVSTERIREELFKCFKFNTLKTLHELNRFPDLRDYIFKNNLLWLKPTMEN
jgi:tRNA nucleotidyltransferase/poly(A) polymerase